MQSDLYYAQNKNRLKSESKDPRKVKKYCYTYEEYIQAITEEYGKDVIVLG